jgi:membrane protease YdiL (CAAX protease family)
MQSLETSSAELTSTPAPRQSFFREVPWGWSDVLIGLAPAAAARASSALISPEWAATVPRWLWVPIAVLGQAWFLGYTLAIARRRCGRLPQFPRARADFVETLWALLALPVVFVAVATILSLVIPYLTGNTDLPRTPVEGLARSPDRFDSLSVMILAILAAPVAEETLFRGLLYNALRQRLPLPVAAVLQAVVFGLLHPFDPGNSIAVGLIGFALAVVYEWRKTLLAPVLLHTFVNVAGMAIIASNMAAEANAPTLGVYGGPQEGGCRITKLLPGGAAETAGLQVGDVVTAVDEVAVADIPSMAQVVRSKRVGERVSVDFTRGGETHRVEAVLKKRRE